MISVFTAAAGSLSEIYEESRRISRLSEIRLVYDCRSAADIRSLTEIPILHDLLSFCEQIDLFIQNALVGSRETIRQLSAAFIQNQK